MRAHGRWLDERGVEQPAICAPQNFGERRPNWKNKNDNISYINAEKLKLP
jgi:hypothetical protein